jgi:hypothetical protein
MLALTYLGYYLGKNWDEVGDFLHYVPTRSPWLGSLGGLPFLAQTLSIFA